MRYCVFGGILGVVTAFVSGVVLHLPYPPLWLWGVDLAIIACFAWNQELGVNTDRTAELNEFLREDQARWQQAAAMAREIREQLEGMKADAVRKSQG